MSKVFISHRTSDMSPATKLAMEIRAAGHEVWLDDWEIGTGDSITEKIYQGLRDAEYVVLCLSSQGVDNKWIGREWLSTLARQLNGDSVMLLPVRLTGGELPEILADIKYADLVKDWSGGLASLLRAIK